MKSFIKSNLKLQNYEIKIIKYVCLCFISETSKFFLLLLFFYFQNHIKEYLVSLLILLPLRWYSGGLHLKHYLSCLCASLIFFVMAICIFPKISMPAYLYDYLYFTSLLVHTLIAPVSSTQRIALLSNTRIKVKLYSISFLIFYGIIIYILDNSTISIIILGTIVIHTFQLLFAYAIKVVVSNEL